MFLKFYIVKVAVFQICQTILMSFLFNMFHYSLAALTLHLPNVNVVFHEQNRTHNVVTK